MYIFYIQLRDPKLRVGVGAFLIILYKRRLAVLDYIRENTHVKLQ